MVAFTAYIFLPEEEPLFRCLSSIPFYLMDFLYIDIIFSNVKFYLYLFLNPYKFHQLLVAVLTSF